MRCRGARHQIASRSLWGGGETPAAAASAASLDATQIFAPYSASALARANPVVKANSSISIASGVCPPACLVDTHTLHPPTNRAPPKKLCAACQLFPALLPNLQLRLSGLVAAASSPVSGRVSNAPTRVQTNLCARLCPARRPRTWAVAAWLLFAPYQLDGPLASACDLSLTPPLRSSNDLVYTPLFPGPCFLSRIHCPLPSY